MTQGKLKHWLSSGISCRSINSSKVAVKVSLVLLRYFQFIIASIFTDDIFLLQFLRTKKYSVDQAFSVLENNLLFCMNHSDWFDLSDSRIQRMKEFCRVGFIYPLAERTSDGRQIVFINQPRVDPDIFSSDDVFHLFFVLIVTLLLEEETQIAGLTFIGNHENVSMKYISLYSVDKVVNVIKFLKNACPGRFKGCALINLPSIAMFLWNAAKSVMTEKLKERIQLVKSFKDIEQSVHKSLLPKEYGGEKFTEAEMIEKFLQFFDENLNLLRRTKTFDIDEESLSACKGLQDNFGSFRKLEID